MGQHKDRQIEIENKRERNAYDTYIQQLWQFEWGSTQTGKQRLKTKEREMNKIPTYANHGSLNGAAHSQTNRD